MAEIDEFTGEEDSFPAATWIHRVEETAEGFGWTAAQTRLAARRALKGLVETWIRTQPASITWAELKDGLIQEFGTKVDGARVAEKLSKERPKPGESAKAYSLRMLQWGRQAGIPESWTLSYIAQGLPGDVALKAALFHCKSWDELRGHLPTYEILRQQSSARVGARSGTERAAAAATTAQDPRKRDEVCYQCNRPGHRSRDCQETVKTCYNCNRAGHISRDCPDRGRLICHSCHQPDHMARN